MGERLAGKTVWITGGSRGIGAACARAAAAEGARVAISSRRVGPLNDAAAAINADHPDRVHAFPCHVGDAEALAETLNAIEGTLGLPEVLLNNAATNPHYGPLLEAPRSMFDKTMEVNVLGPLNATRLVATRLIEAEKTGSIINVASIQGLLACPLQGVYGMSKAALISMTRTFAAE
jgi:NAD(P)-dependent dehydrogenase (short-subunit alcohol dehydrogenase family)